MTSSPAADAAAALIAELIAHGVRDLVLSPGSRSQSLALAAVHFAQRDLLRVHVRVDERVAGFTALGLSRETGVPTAVVCTSGTAVANLLPAVMEAFHSGIPLLLLTADRPPELRGIGANQATAQPGLFGTFVRSSLDAPVPGDGEWMGLAEAAVATAMGADAEGALPEVAGPVHLNLPTREPLSGAVPRIVVAPGVVPQPVRAEPVVIERGPRTVVIAGADAGAEAEEIAYRGSWPLIAEVVSGARFGRQIVHGYRRLLNEQTLGGRIERAIVLGHPTLSREAARLLARTDLDVIAVRRGGEELNLNGRTRAAASVVVADGPADREWLAAWLGASAALAVDLSEAAPDAEGLASTDPATRRDAVRTELDAVRRPLDRELLVDAVWRATWPHDRLMFGSSRLVRVADGVLGGKKVPVHANRGLAGIDGTIATATGIAAASQAEGAHGVTRVLLGDLAFLHDVGALLLPPDEQAPRMQVIVGNDGGGTIFDGLEVAASAPPTDLDRAFYTPHRVEIEHLALAYGWEYHRVTTRSALDQVLTTPVVGRQIIEVPLAR
ncbi:2-succinyl-5-enolpyruvyl-6-hydroxy-3-cyclohexene-1-carboxylic-acid synthase [Microbacterium sp. ZW T5_45]|uniref:2-succinyl-5-enolpyruvyl-6-hydroxy-3- cyclohexene-1-carboxylic-acid synthase n=1 Tax=Microbacterium sp. ZW T5_45 TaxID=3378080 RepID=UPI0038538422